MIRIAWRSLLAHKLRTVLTTLAILLGVAMISGTYVLTDQIDSGFKQIFTDAYQGTDVMVTRKASFTTDYTAGSAGLPQGMVGDVAAVNGVAEAYGYVSAQGAVAVDGKIVETRGAPTLFFGGPASDLSSTPYVEGKHPSAPGEVGIIRKLAEDESLTVGSPITLITPDGTREATVSGVFTFGAESSLGGSLLITTSLADAQEWFDMAGRVSEIDVKAEAGTSAETLAAGIRRALPSDVSVKTGEEAATDQTRQISETLDSYLTPALLAFGGIAVLVGAFIIFNAFSMTVAQRRREFAMLRALGASRSQVLATVAGEAFGMGVFASVLGLFSGLGVASIINQLFKAVGADIPRGGLTLEPRTIVVALAVGIGVTMISALVPAVRATRVPPMAALQEGATLPPSRFARFTPYAAVVALALGVLAIAAGMYGSGSTTERLVVLAVGAVLVFLAVAMVSRHFVRPVVRLLGWPLQKLSPVAGRLARDNSLRDPARTAATASALMIGLGVVVFVAVFAQGLKSSFIDTFDKTVRADIAISGKNYLTLPNDTLKRVRNLPGVEDAAGMNTQMVRVGAKPAALMSVDPSAFRRVWAFDWVKGGSDGLLGELGTTNAVVEEEIAKGLGIAKGETFAMLTSDGIRRRFKVIGEYHDPMMLSGIVVSDAAYNELYAKPSLYMVLVRGDGSGRALGAVKAALADDPAANVQTAQEYKDTTISMVNQLLNLLYGLLAMSVLISLFGIVNTLVLSVFERTREIGLIRAIGGSRSQVRATVRYESVITSVIGALLGIGIGIVFAYVVTTRFIGQGITFSVPWGQLLIFLIIGVIVGVIAAILPARRAARIDILEAIQYE